jgi:hypothetical protein
MSHRFVFDSSPATRAVRRGLVGAALVVAGYLAALLASISVAILGGPGSDNASDAGAAASSAFAQKAPPEAAIAASRAQHDFDYFPDHYTNQAREVAEQPPTF